MALRCVKWMVANGKRQIVQGEHPSLRTVLLPAHNLSAVTGPDLRCYTFHVSGDVRFLGAPPDILGASRWVSR